MNLSRQVEQLFRDQLAAWPRLKHGVEGLAQAQTRAAAAGRWNVFIRHIPHRAGSTTAAVDADSIARRPCFLCPENLDPEEQGIPFGADYVIYCNPFPIVDLHLSIVHREHRPQRIAGEFGRMLDLAEALPGQFVIFNGAECGASAPDHMHFQAGSRVLFPIERDLEDVQGPAVLDYERNLILFRGGDRGRLIERAERAIDLLSEVTGKHPEPLLNIAAFHSGGAWTVYLFPRSRHRPGVYFTGELVVSPGTIDLCGLFVVPFAKDFARISGRDVAAIYREVTLPEGRMREVTSRL
jgi:hypothetical protein